MDARERTRQQQEHIGEHVERVHDQEHVAHKAGERTHPELSLQDELASEPQERDARHVHRELEDRQVEDGCRERMRCRAGKLPVDFGKALLSPRLPHVGLDGTYCDKVFLEDGIEPVHRGLELREERRCMRHDKEERKRQAGQDDDEDDCKLRAHGE